MNLISQLIELINHHELWEKDVTLNRNDFLKENGSTDTNLYLVIDGSVRIFVVDESEEHTIRFGYQNNLIAALDSFIHEQTSDLNIQALKKTTLKVISKKAFMDFMLSSPNTIELWYKLLENFVLQQMERERDILTSSPIERYHRVLQRSPLLFQEIPDKYIASYLRMTPKTLSRIKKS